MANFPDNGRPLSFEELTEPVCKAIRFAYGLKRKNRDKDIAWSGPTLRSANALPPEEALKSENLLYCEEDQGRDALMEIVGLAIQLGIEQGRRITMTGNEVSLLKLKIEHLRLRLRD